MDTSKEYIKMSDCPEAQVSGYTTLSSEEGIQYVGDNVFVELDRCSTTWRTVRLLRQSQIQEMMGKDYENTLDMLCDFYAVITVDQPTGFQQMFEISMEQLWLVFYMFKNHQKIWDGEKWRNNERD